MRGGPAVLFATGALRAPLSPRAELFVATASKVLSASAGYASLIWRGIETSRTQNDGSAQESPGALRTLDTSSFESCCRAGVAGCLNVAACLGPLAAISRVALAESLHL